MLDLLIDALLDCLKILPFLFAAYLFMEFLEQKTEDGAGELTRRAGKLGPFIGGLLGIIPQCGFSSAASNLFAGRVISFGTLLAVYLSTSDEMLPLFLSHGLPLSRILPILFLKAVVAMSAGFLADAILSLKRNRDESFRIEELCEQEHCHCEEDGNILKAAFVHTLKIISFVFVITLILNFLVETVGEETIASFLSDRLILGHLLAALVGLIPNCAASIVISELYLQSLISFGMAMSGLFVSAGVGLLVLFRVNHHRKENLQVVLTLYAVGAAAGILFDLLGIVI
ncbi:MAG: arsenic efflux protein [Oscillospiraceae bacterium]|nr:arsenic efflux protein [Erysipelotrichaceae bacterium]MBR2552517.1 arsenic efflux protein [Erysipelotrichaceae bacterium]MBR2591463.1 arsenic efflux protein [Oscillospiraceae bacterium]MBR4121693.1 arsenic efflux protein [Erysipelotrichaceae bacterium]